MSIARFAESLEHKNADGTAWEASHGFLWQFFKRYSLQSRRVYVERNDCPDFGNWIENVLEPLLQRYETWDIYNADETSLFFKSLSDRTMSFDGEQPTGSKLTSSKDHLSLMLYANMTGTDKQKPVLVGKAANPACLKKKGLSIANLGVNYYHNAKGWNRELYKQKRKITLLVDNAPGHIADDYDNIELVFLPPNTTSKLQPLDQGIIKRESIGD